MTRKDIPLPERKAELEVRKLEQETSSWRFWATSLGGVGVLFTILFGLFNLYRTTSEARNARIQQREAALTKAFVDLLSPDDGTFAAGAVALLSASMGAASESFVERLLDAIVVNPGGKAREPSAQVLDIKYSPYVDYHGVQTRNCCPSRLVLPAAGGRVYLLRRIVENLDEETRMSGYRAILGNRALGTERLIVLPELAGSNGGDVWADAFEGGDAETRAIVATLLGRDSAAASLGQLKEWVLADSFDDRTQALTALSLASPEDLGRLVDELFANEDTGVALGVLAFLRYYPITPDHKYRLVEVASTSETVWLRVGAAYALGELPEDERAMSLFDRSLTDPVGHIADAALGSATRYCDDRPARLEWLLGTLSELETRTAWQWPLADFRLKVDNENSKLAKNLRLLRESIESAVAAADEV